MRSNSKIRVLIVDDSAFFRRRLAEMLSGIEGIEVIGEAANGQEAVRCARQLRPDLITMDVEMPVMNGIEAVKRIMAESPTAILILSSLTQGAAMATLDALDAGAVDFLSKDFEKTPGGQKAARRLLAEQIYALTGRPGAPQGRPPPQTAHAPPRRRGAGRDLHYQLVAIGASTGGPVALQTILTGLPADFPLPILLVVHMPANFTPAFAKRLDAQSRIRVKEAADGDRLKPGLALLAPGGSQMTIAHGGPHPSVRIEAAAPDQMYRPSVDITFRSLAEHFHNRVLAVILTGMGADGLEGARLLKARGATLWSQDKASCVVFGMPQVVQKAGLSDRVLPVDQIGPTLIKAV